MKRTEKNAIKYEVYTLACSSEKHTNSHLSNVLKDNGIDRKPKTI